MAAFTPRLLTVEPFGLLEKCNPATALKNRIMRSSCQTTGCEPVPPMTNHRLVSRCY